MFSTPALNVIGTPLLATSYAQLRADLLAARGRSLSIDFSNTHIVTARRHDPQFRAATAFFDAFVPDGMPLVWTLNAQGAGLEDRVYGPTFFRHFLENSPADVRHFFLGGSGECLALLAARMRALNPGLTVAGMQHGYFPPPDEEAVVQQILAAGAEFLWVGLGTPKQQDWIRRHRAALPGVIILAVGFAFDVNAGTKRDAPAWMQRLGLTWLYRLLSEPGRLWRRYLVFNSLFLWYLARDHLFRPRRATR